MFEARARGRIDPETDDAAQDNVARGRRDTGADHLPRHRDLLRDESVFLEGRDKFFVLFDRQRAGRDAAKPVAGLDFGAAWRRIESHLIGRSANDRCAAAAHCGECKHHYETHGASPR